MVLAFEGLEGARNKNPTPHYNWAQACIPPAIIRKLATSEGKEEQQCTAEHHPKTVLTHLLKRSSCTASRESEPRAQQIGI
eukprot:scaffold262925_cov16-Tisochrysis_lutea.AAC.1